MIFRLSFAGIITKVEVKAIGQNSLHEISLCKKNRKKEGEEDSYTWVRINLWDAADFQRDKLVKGAFIAGSGEFHLRSFVDKSGAKRQSAEVRCVSYDVEVGEVAQPKGEAHEPPKAPPRATAAQVVAQNPVDPEAPPF